MKLKSFGCSFIFGTDLSDDGSSKDYFKHSQLTWPSLLAKKLNLEYDCHAQAGSGNLKILETVLSQCENTEKNLYVIGWTWIDRFDYTNTEVRPWNPQGWKTMLPNDDSKQAKFYYKNIHSQFRDKLVTLSYIKLAIHTLQQKKCPFIMTFVDDLIFENTWHVTPAVIDMQRYIRPFMSDFQGKNFVEWSRDKKFSMSRTMHPLEQAHAAAAELVHNDLDKWIKS